MNKKQRLVIGSSIIIALLVYLAFSQGITANQFQVSEAVAAKDQMKDKIMYVNGSMLPGSDWDPVTHILKFKLTDGISTIDVIFKGDKPNIPPLNENGSNIQAVVTGQFNGSAFEAYKMLTKCPSKYEADIKDIKK
ncbi:MAG: cytochrome c maturation protein CcmE [Candidatus Methanoperedens sp.]|nr:cytochrome c maturation protein CcmE [Candidatus Methanoperedens sp.]